MEKKSVPCPICSKIGYICDGTRFECENCRSNFLLDQLIAETFKSEFQFYYKDGNYCVNNLNDESILFEFGTWVLNSIVIKTTSILAIKKIVEFCSSYNIRTLLVLSVPNPIVNCPICREVLSVAEVNDKLTLKCSHGNHKFSTKNLYVGVASLLSHMYTEYSFEIDHNEQDEDACISVSKTVITPASKQNKLQIFLHGKQKDTATTEDFGEITLNVGHGEAVVLIPKSMQTKIGDMEGFINSLNISNLRSVLTNN